jgi:hypothetical protein
LIVECTAQPAAQRRNTVARDALQVELVAKGVQIALEPTDQVGETGKCT